MRLKGAKKNKCIVCSVSLDGTNTTWYRQKNYIHKCNDCTRSEKREWATKYREANRSVVNERSNRYNKKLQKENPVRYSAKQMYSSARKRANALGLPFNINTDYIQSISPQHCPVFGWHIKYGGGQKIKMSASLDKIIPKKGYVKGNVMVMSLLANTMKNEATPGELLQFSKWISRKEIKD